MNNTNNSKKKPMVVPKRQPISNGVNSKYKIIAVLFLTAVCAAGLCCRSHIEPLPVSEEKSAPETPPAEITTEPTAVTPTEPVTPTYNVLPVFKLNDALDVEEEIKWDGAMTLREEDSDKTKTYPFYKQYLHNYTEKINLISDDQLHFQSERYYTLSSIKSNMPDTGRTLTKTSLENKTLALASKNYQICSCEKIAPKKETIISDDYAYVNAFNWVYFLLPEAGTVLEVGASYQVKGKELGKIIFREYFDDKSCVISGTGVLEEVTDKSTARLLITLKIKQTETDDTVLTADLIGFCKIPINSEPALDLEISGPFNMTLSSLTPEGKKLLSSADGILKIKSKITLKK